ncbi:hypothetical protein EDB80DRAFT_690416 [Ilyonectria destructans]|nr:hypothetical protein EDB80DRAFT_690416 [Ilyonectria destructans]
MSGRLLQSFISIGLSIVCIGCYILLIILYFKPSIYHIESLVNPERKSIKPTVAVSLLAALLAASTSVFVTRCVEHSLWIDLRKGPDEQHPNSVLTVGETRRLAQWATSTLDRLLYVFGGFKGEDKRSWLLRFAGPLLVATAAVSPVLLVGISQSALKTVTTETVPRTADPWLSHLDTGNSRYRGGNSYDNPTAVAALAAMRNLSAPIAPLCEDLDSRSTCSVSARVVAIRARCTASSRANPDGVGTIANGEDSKKFCAGKGTASELCVELVASSPATYAVFASGPAPCTKSDADDCPAAGIHGTWARIYGVWVNGVDITVNSTHRINIIDCTLTYGNITVGQNGTSPPTLDRSTYTQSTSTKAYQYGFSEYSIIQLNRIYSELNNSPYDWDAAAVGTGSNTLYRNSMGFLLLGEDANNDAETVARQIEANFDMATLHAFARGPNSSELVFARSHSSPVYVYQPLVLLILLVPLLATILGSWTRWRVAGDTVKVGYDPVGIARLGPVRGMAQGSTPSKESRKLEDSLIVSRWRPDRGNQDQAVGFVTGFQVNSPQGDVFISQQGPTNEEHPGAKGDSQA